VSRLGCVVYRLLRRRIPETLAADQGAFRENRDHAQLSQDGQPGRRSRDSFAANCGDQGAGGLSLLEASSSSRRIALVESLVPVLRCDYGVSLMWINSCRFLEVVSSPIDDTAGGMWR
jgi:hypothetical protein